MHASKELKKYGHNNTLTDKSRIYSGFFFAQNVTCFTLSKMSKLEKVPTLCLISNIYWAGF